MSKQRSMSSEEGDSLSEAHSNLNIKVNESLFKPSEWDDYPLKRDDKHANKIVQPEFVPFSNSCTLPAGFEFVSLDVRKDEVIAAITEFLNANYYPEENGNALLFDSEHVKWTLRVPTTHFERKSSFLGHTVVGVAAAQKGTLVGLIASRPIVYRVDSRLVYSLEVGWLCTLEKLRGKGLASVLMKELYRRAHQWGLDTGMLFAVPKQLPALFVVGPVHTYRKRLDKRIPEPTKHIDLIRFANLRDVTKMMKIYKKYRERWRLHREYNRKEFEHTFLKRGCVFTYVIRNDRGDVLDYVSLYPLQTRSGESIAYVHFVSFSKEKLLQLFLHNLLFILRKNKFSEIHIPDVGGVTGAVEDGLAFERIPSSDRYFYQFNYNTQVIDVSQSQISYI